MYKLDPKFVNSCDRKMRDGKEYINIPLFIKSDVYNYPSVRDFIDTIRVNKEELIGQDFLTILVAIPTDTTLELLLESNEIHKVNYIHSDDKILKMLNEIELFVKSNLFIKE